MTDIAVREFNDPGLREFAVFLKDVKTQEKLGRPVPATPVQLLADPKKTTAVQPNVIIDDGRVFSTRYKLATYLDSVFPANFEKDRFDRFGLWAWIALLYLNQFRSMNKIQRQEHFIPDEFEQMGGTTSLWYRQCVRTPVVILRQFGDDFAKLCLSGRPAHQLGDFTESVMGNQKILRSDAIRDTLLKLYQSKTGGVRKGVVNHPCKKKRGSDSGKGALRRFIKPVHSRLKLGYDIEEMSPDDIVEIWGDEIKGSKWVSPAT